MFLKKLSLTNFKSIAHIEISFEKNDTENRKWTLLLGENGTGKSQVLKAIALVTCGSNALGELLGHPDSWIRNNENSCTITAILQNKKVTAQQVSLVINRGDSLLEIISNNKKSLAIIDGTVVSKTSDYFVTAYGAGRCLFNGIFSNSEKNSNSHTLNIRNLFDNATALNPLAAWIIELDYRLGNTGFDVVKDALTDLLPGISFYSIDKEKKQVLFQTVDGIVPLDQLSGAHQNIALWIGDVLFRITETYKNYKNPLTVTGLLLIDEIDLHLHPKWQRKLYDFISTKLPNFQVVATTHSPLTAQQADAGELYALKRNSDQMIELIPFIGSPKSLLVNQLLMAPVFGLDTDESYEVQETKKEYKALKAKAKNVSLNKTEQGKMGMVKKKLQLQLPKRAIFSSSEKELDLLQRIEAQLNIKK